ncbi:NADH dehydrogenase subunit 5 [Alteribacillus iranensis]|uniref:Probable inorganic carbon transporter subunit DabB n=1 Tax=Alteribacillus iranensis TaxID=930128 RepID=A0A1I2DKC4_9BACI|nr:NADH dehydrogenase subunit 5 [Alteribacillus iranensis]SFE80966.1 NAD(P)H-quinone oxidoreductase subunit 5 [Alteribacillus iranensis]
MLFSLSSSTFITLYFIALIASWISGLLFLHPSIPLRYIRVHLAIFSIPPLVCFTALLPLHQSDVLGIWYADSLAWLLAFFILLIGLVIQRFSVNYLKGDRSYRKYFTLFTFTTSMASIAWLSDDLRLMLLCWGATLVGLVLLLCLNNSWNVVSQAVKVTRRLFFVSWIALLLAVMWIAHLTGQWRLSTIFTEETLAHIGPSETIGINLLIILAVMIPAAQWPFQRWLIESVVAPTPVSAIMHAGLVNAGGIILTRFSPLFHGDIAQFILLVLSSISVFIGTGISLVQVDYKRQLVGSTIAQMGFMLIQCALGAYLAALIHLVLHGLFKASLFLQSGSVLRRFELLPRYSKRASYVSVLAGRGLGLLLGLSYWLMAPGDGYQLVSALILGWSLSFAWTQLIVFGYGKIGKLIGSLVLLSAMAIYMSVHTLFHEWLHATDFHSTQPPMPAVIFVVILLLAGSIIGALIARHHSSPTFAVLYLWLVHLGEAKEHSVESHPHYLSPYTLKGGNE